MSDTYPPRFSKPMQRYESADGLIEPRSSNVCRLCGHHVSRHRPADSACPQSDAAGKPKDDGAERERGIGSWDCEPK